MTLAEQWREEGQEEGRALLAEQRREIDSPISGGIGRENLEKNNSGRNLPRTGKKKVFLAFSLLRYMNINSII